MPILTLDDFRKLRDKLTEGQSLGARFWGASAKRAAAAWHQTESPPRHWYNVPWVQERLNTCATGRADVDHRDYVAETYLKGGHKTALSMGCGAGSKELAWAKTGVFERIDAFDLSPNRIREAIVKAETAGFVDLLHFQVGDATTFHPPQSAYDVVIAEASLHHFSGLKALIPRLHNWLKPDGLLVLHEYVGPARFQWTPEQLREANALLAKLPDTHRTVWGHSRLKSRCYQPGRLAMWLNDPSEAVESDQILPLLRQHFREVEVRALGGTLLHLLLADIAHHFITPDETALSLLREAAATEDRMEVSDFVFAVFRR